MASEEGRLVERVAFCSVLCAGFVYAGYNVITKVFHKRTPTEEKNVNMNLIEDISIKSCSNKAVQTEEIIRRFFSESTDRDSAKSVRERINDINLITQHLRKNSVPVSPEIRPQNVHINPWSSPLGCAKYLSVSAENISIRSPCSSPEHRGKSKLTASQGTLNAELQSRLIKIQLSDKITKEMLHFEDSSVTIKTLNNLQKSPSKMTLFEAKNIVSLLNSSNEDILLKTLYTVSNCAAFASNQELLCESGCPKRLKDLLLNQPEVVKIGVTQAISNLAVIDKSSRYFQSHIPILLNQAVCGKELLKSLSLTALANLALDQASHKLIMVNVNNIMHMARHGTSIIQLQALRLLVNLSCNKDIVPFLLISEVSPDILELSNSSDREVVLRILTFLANIVTFATQYFDNSPRSTLVSVLYQLVKRTESLNLSKLSSETDEDISFQARRLHKALLVML